MAAKNFGQISGPFQAGQEVLLKIQEQEEDDISSLVKVGIFYIGNFDLDLTGTRWKQTFVRINGIEFQIGITRMLELQDVKITSIQFVEDTDDLIYIDYQYHKFDEDNA